MLNGEFTFYDGQKAEILHGDCLTELRRMDADSVDAVVTDPPAGISFMGKHWDSDKGGREEWIAWLAEVMAECLRVLKPGGHALVWAIPRTSHWTGTALETAGFEIRDCITHLFGSGFPKSTDVSKQLDKAAGAEREIISECGSDGVKRKPRAMAPGRAERSAVQTVTAPATDAAKQWQGWGTALKPAAEFWWVARKPISEKTVAANVLKWGTGGLNIDGCRIEAPDANLSAVQNQHNNSLFQANGAGHSQSTYNPKGRFPANLILSHSPYCTDDQCDIECAIQMLDEQSGTLKSGARKAGVRKGMGFHGADGDGGPAIEANEGGPSRFFYVAKVSPSERGDSTHPTMKGIKLMRYLCRLVTPPGGTVLDPFAGSGSTGLAALQEGFRFIGIEREAEYVEIARKRIEGATWNP